jgi:uncharacterized protein (TIGR02646 family)
MRGIVKGAEPASLTAHRKTQQAGYGNYADKQTLREHLLNEQRGLCCYCMGRIHAQPTKMKIEHWQCQDRYPHEQLRYHNNLLAACCGGEGRPEDKQHCDTKKKNIDLMFNPAEKNHHIETRVRYEINGRIGSGDVDFDRQLNEVLNLNLQILANNRKGVIDGLADWLNMYRAKNHQGPDNRTLQKKRDQWLSANGLLQPYARVAIYWLDLRLARIQG